MIETFSQTLATGITLSCRAAGKPGRPVLMFLHGFPEAAFVWDELMIHFAQPDFGGYRCIAPNLRGFEQSSAPREVEAYRAKHVIQDIAALIEAVAGGGDTTPQLECLVAHDWGGALAWGLANQKPQLMRRLAIINSPHTGTFLRDMKSSVQQQDASAYMNFLIRHDAERLLAEDDYRRLWEFFTHQGVGAARRPAGARWLTDAVRDQYRAVWNAGLTGGCNYYRASPLRPARPNDPAAASVNIPHELLTVSLPTLVVWAMEDAALPPALVEGLDAYVPDLTLHKVPDASHWIIHEQPELVARLLSEFLARKV